jgi:hypothetical protein
MKVKSKAKKASTLSGQGTYCLYILVTTFDDNCLDLR